LHDFQRNDACSLSKMSRRFYNIQGVFFYGLNISQFEAGNETRKQKLELEDGGDINECSV